MPSSCCAFCYKLLSDTEAKKCGRCRKRMYCSAECQKLDWGTGGQHHSKYCALNCGEENVVWEVQFMNDQKGYGVVALCDIARGQRIMVEKIVMRKEGKGLRGLVTDPSPTVLEALMELGPFGEDVTLEQKVALNNMQLGPLYHNATGAWTGICPKMARLNHRCNNNADHIFVPTTKMDSSGIPCGVLVCFATSPIKQGEEIFITYSGQIDTGKSREDNALHMNRWWGFTCSAECECVSDPGFESRILQMHQLNGQYEASLDRKQSLKKAKDLLAMYDRVGHVSQQFYSRVCFNAFQIAILAPDTLAEARGFIQRAHDELYSVIGHDTETTLEFKRYIANPSSNGNYMRG